MVGVIGGGGRINVITNTPLGEDLLSLHAAGTIITTAPSALFDDDVGRRVQAETFGPVGREVFNRYLSPPHTAFVFAPLARLPFAWALTLWTLLALAALVAVPLLLGVARPLGSVVAMLAFVPVQDGLVAGQNALLTAGLFALVHRAWRDDRGWLAGGALGLVAIYKPHLIAGPALLFAMEARRDPRPLIGLSLTGMGLLALDIGLFPEQSRAFVAWGQAVMTGHAPVWSQLRPGGEFTVAGFFALALPGLPGSARALGWAGQVAAVIAFVTFVRRQLPADRVRTARAGRAAYAAATVLTLWLAPHAHLYEWTLLLIPACLLWQDPDARGRLLPVYAAFALLVPVSVRLARLQWDAMGSALHLSVPLLILATITIAAVAPDSRKRPPIYDGPLGITS